MPVNIRTPAPTRSPRIVPTAAPITSRPSEFQDMVREEARRLNAHASRYNGTRSVIEDAAIQLENERNNIDVITVPVVVGVPMTTINEIRNIEL